MNSSSGLCHPHSSDASVGRQNRSNSMRGLQNPLNSLHGPPQFQCAADCRRADIRMRFYSSQTVLRMQFCMEGIVRQPWALLKLRVSKIYTAGCIKTGKGKGSPREMQDCKIGSGVLIQHHITYKSFCTAGTLNSGAGVTSAAHERKARWQRCTLLPPAVRKFRHHWSSAGLGPPVLASPHAASAACCARHATPPPAFPPHHKVECITQVSAICALKAPSQRITKVKGILQEPADHAYKTV